MKYEEGEGCQTNPFPPRILSLNYLQNPDLLELSNMIICPILNQLQDAQLVKIEK